ncbi:hypothetical protein CIRG_07488 [Coccidioides immitis RMSCC 2394]|uniref:Uncharacterized protein n=1 Tax=Coccidioides immitis RMSCC 2394 TaxID=404692 RepID=A0A0J7BCJ0_COCIT|nr:hypothetical protein CIRG_07488 [Coccidioides immitis RMSCC 2394]
MGAAAMKMGHEGVTFGEEVLFGVDEEAVSVIVGLFGVVGSAFDVVFVAVERLEDLVIVTPLDDDGCMVTVEIRVSVTGGAGIGTVMTFGEPLSVVVEPPST